jgi:rRNA maturation RNase YbeY
MIGRVNLSIPRSSLTCASFPSDLPTIANSLLRPLGLSDFDLSLHFVSRSRMLSLNDVYRFDSSTTDILAFPFQQRARPLTGFDLNKLPRPIKVKDSDSITYIRDLGSLYLCLPYINSPSCSLLGSSVAMRINTLLIHGIAHLCGFDHKTNKQTQAMEQAELLISSALSPSSHAILEVHRQRKMLKENKQIKGNQPD